MKAAAPRRRWAWAALAVLLAVAPLPWAGGLATSVLSQVGIAIIACLSYNVLFGQTGLVSFGHAVYTGLGAFAAMHALRAIGAGHAAWLPVSLVPLVGGAAAAAVGALLGWAITRRAGLTFAMITLAIGELVWAVALMLPEYFGGEGGLTADRSAGPVRAGISFGPALQVYGLIALYCGACTLALYGLTRTPLGRLMNAVRDNPERVAFLGYSAQRVRHLALVASAFFAGIAGALAALLFEIVSTEVLGAARSGSVLLFTFLGGAGSFGGPIVGAVLMVSALVLLSQWTPAWALYVGGAFLATVVWAPGGLTALAARHGRRLRRQAALRPAYLRWVLGAGAAVAGAVVLVELLYARQLDTYARGPVRVWGLALDAAAPLPWAGAALLALAGAALAWHAARILRRHEEAA